MLLVLEIVSMKLSRMLERFIKEAPVATMARAILERAFPDKALDDLFDRTAERQYEDTLLFSTVVKSWRWWSAGSGSRCGTLTWRCRKKRVSRCKHCMIS